MLSNWTVLKVCRLVKSKCFQTQRRGRGSTLSSFFFYLFIYYYYAIVTLMFYSHVLILSSYPFLFICFNLYCFTLNHSSIFRLAQDLSFF